MSPYDMVKSSSYMFVRYCVGINKERFFLKNGKQKLARPYGYVLNCNTKMISLI